MGECVRFLGLPSALRFSLLGPLAAFCSGLGFGALLCVFCRRLWDLYARLDPFFPDGSSDLCHSSAICSAASKYSSVTGSGFGKCPRSMRLFANAMRDVCCLSGVVFRFCVVGRFCCWKSVLTSVPCSVLSEFWSVEMRLLESIEENPRV